MSLDFDLVMKQAVEVGSFNYTHNITNMWKRAGVYEALYLSGNQFAHSVVDVLQKGVDDMRAHPEVYKELDAPNGWGTYDTALPWLEKVLAKCKEYPKATIVISR